MTTRLGPLGPLGGFVGQSMGGPRPYPEQETPYVFPASVSAYSWSPPVIGRWKFIGWGPGGGGSVGGAGASGGYFEKTCRINTIDVVTIAAGLVNLSNTSVVIPAGVFGGGTATATRANGATPGTATGGDVNLAGTAGMSTGTGATGGAGLGTAGGAGGAGSGGTYDGGSGAPGNLPYRGGDGQAGNGGTGGSPAVGAGGGQQSLGSVGAGSGFVLAVLVRRG